MSNDYQLTNFPKLYRLGSRDYVNGLTLFEEMIDTYLKDKTSAGIKTIKIFKVNQFIRSDAKLYKTRDGENLDLGKPAAVINLIDKDDQNIKLSLFIDENSATPPLLEEYDRSQYVSETFTEKDVEKSTLNNISDFRSFIRGIIEVNHRYCCAMAAEIGINKGVSWAYLKNLDWCDEEEFAKLTRINYEQKSDMEHLGKRYVIRNLSFDQRSASKKTEVCFFIPLNNK